LNGRAVAQSAAQAIAEESDGAAASVVSEAVAESIGQNAKSAGQALGTLCNAGEQQIEASAEAVSQAVA